jgi:ATP/maltotriose-dependent transcriptional regulator MalT
MSKLRNYLVDEVLKDFQSVETSFFVETSSTNSINESV